MPARDIDVGVGIFARMTVRERAIEAAERASILEYEAGLPRSTAEERASCEVYGDIKPISE